MDSRPGAITGGSHKPPVFDNVNFGTVTVAAPATAKQQADTHGEIPARPSHSEMVGVLVHHYESDINTVLGWLADLDPQAVRDQLAFA